MSSSMTKIVLACLVFICICFGFGQLVSPKELRGGVYRRFTIQAAKLEEMRKKQNQIIAHFKLQYIVYCMDIDPDDPICQVIK